MIAEVKVPALSLEAGEGTIAQWLKMEGQEVEEGEGILVYETTKVAIVVEAPASGVLRKILYGVGMAVPPNATVALIATDEVTDAEIERYLSQVVQLGGNG
ncbi:MAG: biotin/lipoyl-containing protein [Anaerolineae bacterium]